MLTYSTMLSCEFDLMAVRIKSNANGWYEGRTLSEGTNVEFISITKVCILIMTGRKARLFQYQSLSVRLYGSVAYIMTVFFANSKHDFVNTVTHWYRSQYIMC
jgi:hypothetical protein